MKVWACVLVLLFVANLAYGLCGYWFNLFIAFFMLILNGRFVYDVLTGDE